MIVFSLKQNQKETKLGSKAFQFYIDSYSSFQFQFISFQFCVLPCWRDRFFFSHLPVWEELSIEWPECVVSEAKLVEFVNISFTNSLIEKFSFRRLNPKKDCNWQEIRCYLFKVCVGSMLIRKNLLPPEKGTKVNI